jgi:hypothetical protein
LGSNTWSYISTDYVWNIKDISSINADTVRDFVCFAGFSGKLFTLNGSTGSEIWSKLLGTSVNGTIKELVDTATAIKKHKLFSSGPMSLQIIDPVTSNIELNQALDNSYIFGVTQLNYADSSEPLIVATTMNNHVYVCHSRTNGILFTYSFGSGNSTTAAEKVSALKSVRGSLIDGYTDDFVSGCRDGRIVCFSGGNFNNTMINQIGSSIPANYSLEQNYPNPFNPVTKIHFDVPHKSGEEGNIITLKVFDVTGREIKTLINENLKPGSYEVTFDGSGFASGVYFYRLEGKDFINSKKMLLIK